MFTWKSYLHLNRQKGRKREDTKERERDRT